MFNASSLSHLTLPCILGLALGCASFAVRTSFAQAQQATDPPTVPAETAEHDDSDDLRRSIALDEGVRAETHVALSHMLTDPDSSRSVRCMSIAITFIGPDGKYLGRMSGLEVFDAASDRIMSLDYGGISPRSADLQAAPQTYTIAISPAVDVKWGEVADAEVVVDIFRKI